MFLLRLQELCHFDVDSNNNLAKVRAYSVVTTPDVVAVVDPFITVLSTERPPSLLPQLADIMKWLMSWLVVGGQPCCWNYNFAQPKLHAGDGMSKLQKQKQKVKVEFWLEKEMVKVCLPNVRLWSMAPTETSTKRKKNLFPHWVKMYIFSRIMYCFCYMLSYFRSLPSCHIIVN